MSDHEATIAVVTEQINRFQTRALATNDPELRCWYIRTADALLFDLVSIGAISGERRDEIAQAWVVRYAAALPNAPNIAVEGSDIRH